VEGIYTSTHVPPSHLVLSSYLRRGLLMLGALYSTHVAKTLVESTKFSSLAGTLPSVVKVVIGAMAARAVLGIMAMSSCSPVARVN
jgi:hypothetical protein